MTNADSPSLPQVRPALLVAAGGFAGAVLRYAVAVALPGGFPWGTLAVNVLGSFALGGLLAGLADGAALLTAFGTGFCGAFTTFSSFAVETVELYESGARREAVGNAAVNLLGALLAVGAGGLLATTP